jgi:archaellum biogenesis ATPase FlaH
MPCSAVTRQSTGWQQPENWTTFREALRVCKSEGYRGVGFVFRFPYVGIDLDDCIEEDGMMNALAREVTSRLDTFAEYSRSGKGLHLYCKVTEPIKALKTAGIEIYGEGRFFIATGKELDTGQLDVTDQTKGIHELLVRYGVRPASEQVQKEICVEGERNNRMAAEIGRLYRFYDKTTVRVMAHALNKQICKPPLEDAEVEAILKSIGRRDVEYCPPATMQQHDWEHVEGKRDLDKVPYKGIAKPRGRYISTGFPTLDYDMNDLAPGCVTLLTGRSNAGKSVIVRQIIANAIGQDHKAMLILGEGDQEVFINSLYQCVIGRNQKLYDQVRVNKRWHKEPKGFALAALQRWHRNKMSLFIKSESKFQTMDDLFKMINYEVDAHGHHLIVIDNLMSILTTTATEKNEDQARFMQACHDLAITHRVHVILVLHPRKGQKGDGMEMEDISGSSDLYNKADNVIAVVREYEQSKVLSGMSGRIELLKNRYYPDLTKINTTFDYETGLLHEVFDGKPLPYLFGWEQHLDPAETPQEVLTIVQGRLEDVCLRQMGED